MPKLSISQKNWILSAHVGFAALWTGTVLSMFLLSLRNTHSTHREVLHTLDSAITLLDD
jgi:F0F1-type ATP synthase assembly protein I